MSEKQSKPVEYPYHAPPYVDEKTGWIIEPVYLGPREDVYRALIRHIAANPPKSQREQEQGKAEE